MTTHYNDAPSRYIFNAVLSYMLTASTYEDGIETTSHRTLLTLGISDMEVGFR